MRVRAHIIYGDLRTLQVFSSCHSLVKGLSVAKTMLSEGSHDRYTVKEIAPKQKWYLQH